MKPLTVTYALTLDDVIELHQVAKRPPFIATTTSRDTPAASGFKHTLIGWAILVGATCVVLFALNGVKSSDGDSARSLGASWNWLWYLAPWVVTLLVVWFFVRRALRNIPQRQWERSPSLHQEQTVTFTEQVITLITSDVKTEWQWSAFDAWVETPSQFVLCIDAGQQLYLTFPKRALSPEETEILRDEFSSRIGPVGSSSLQAEQVGAS